MSNYDHRKIEQKWQKKWEEEGIYSPNLEDTKPKDKFYNLWMFPYPSGEGLHAGHAFASTGSDAYGRFMRMRGKTVFQPIGYDSFGIHSENFAIKTGEHPTVMLDRTTKNYEKQLRSLGHGYDWTRTVTTSDVDYYKWTQWLFIQMFKAGLAYRKEAPVNWCPSCKTVLADEQVVGGKNVGMTSDNEHDRENEAVRRVCERCGTEVEIRNLAQWFFRITSYADRLLSNLDKIDWTEKVVTAQRNWIGKKEGIIINYPIFNSQLSKNKKEIGNISCWTSRPETNYGATFVVVSPEYAKENLIDLIPQGYVEKCKRYIEVSLEKSQEERQAEGRKKTGTATGLFAVNELNGYEMPIYIADFVLSGVGTGAVVGVPGHDKRDFEFAKEFDLEIKPVVIPVRDYSDENARDYYSKRSKFHKELLLELIKEANKARKKIILQGGWAVYAHIAIEFRDFEDIDLVVLEEDLDWWRDQLRSHNLKISNMFPEGKNDNYYFQGTKDDIHVDVEAIQIGKNGNVVWLGGNEPEESGKFEDIFELKELEGNKVYVMNKAHLFHNKKNNSGSPRWKESADLLMLGFEPNEGEGVLINSDFLNGLGVQQAKSKMMDYLEEKGWGERSTNYHLRDWLISRQRYWGPPIPMIFCDKCESESKGWIGSDEHKEWTEQSKSKFPDSNFQIPNSSDWKSEGWWPEDNLPVELPNLTDYKPKGTGRGPLADHPEFYEVKCPHCGGQAKRETDVSDTFLDSAWYFLRYPSVNEEQESKEDKFPISNFQFPNKSQISNTKSKQNLETGNSILEIPWNPDITRHWLPVDLYFGGAEHSVLHLMYARFVWMVLRDMGHLDFSSEDSQKEAEAQPRRTWDEPFPKFYAHGLMIKDGAKMSKSKGNVVNPDEYVDKFGADTLRLYLMFMGPMDGYPDFRDTGIEGMRRFVQKVWGLYQITNSQLPISKQISNIKSEKKLETAKSKLETEQLLLTKMHQTIKKVTEDMENYRYNTAISAIMEYVNTLRVQVTGDKPQVANKSKISNSKSQPAIYHLPSTIYLKVLALLIAPFAPHMAEEAWEILTKNQTLKTKSKKTNSIHLAKWPEYDPSLIIEDVVTIAIQVNGKLRTTLRITNKESGIKEDVIKLAKADPKVSKWIEGQQIKKEIFIPGKLVNLVTR